MKKFKVHKETAMTQKIHSMMILLHKKAREQAKTAPDLKKYRALKIYPKKTQ